MTFIGIRCIINICAPYVATWASHYGAIKRKIVLYRGESIKLVNGIEYINVTEYLMGLHTRPESMTRNTSYFSS